MQKGIVFRLACFTMPLFPCKTPANAIAIALFSTVDMSLETAVKGCTKQDRRP